MRNIYRCSRLPALVLGLFLFAASTVSANVVRLTDGNSAVGIDTMSNRGVYSWEINGIDQLRRQWFYFRAGNSNFERSIDALDLVFINLEDANGSPGDERVVMIYADRGGNFDISVDLTLAGGSGSDATMVEAIRIHNRRTTPLPFNFYQYVDFNLLGTALGDTAEMVSANAVYQTEGSVSIAETVVTPRPSRFEVSTFPSILNRLEDNLPTVLSNNAGPVTGDVAWAFQWNFTLPGDGTYVISKIKHMVVPEPSAIAMLAAGIMGLALVSLRRRGL